MTKSALYFLIISSGLLLFYFVLIIYTWFYRYFTELKTAKVKKQLEVLLASFFLAAAKEKNILQRVNAILKLKSFVKHSATRKESLINIIIDYGDDFIESNHSLLMNLYIVTGIKAFLIKRLTSRSFFLKSLACRQLGALKLKNTEAYIRKLIFCDNNDVKYNVMLALAKLGDTRGLRNILTNKSENIRLSYRAIIEIVSVYNGSKEELFEETLELCDDYIKGILIKSAADYKIEVLREYYVKYLKSEDKNLRIACIRALCELINSVNEEAIVNMLEDKDWEVRAAAAKSLGKIGTSNCFAALEKTISDSEWWVRHNAACTLILLPGGREYASRIINGRDQYAREAVVSAIEMLD